MQLEALKLSHLGERLKAAQSAWDLHPLGYRINF